MSPTWAIVATVDEPAQLVVAFVAHHLAIGASEIHLFLDRPCEETQTLLAGFRACHVTVCTEAHWQAALGRRPHLHTRRQNVNANLAYQICKADWILHCDADEFVRDGAALGEELLRFGHNDLHLRLAVAERVQPRDEPQVGIFDGIFRLAGRLDFDVMDQIYHPLTLFFDRGLTGHPTGKALVRTGRGLKLAIHQPEGDIPARRIRQTRLLHFDGLTQFHYLLKLLRRACEKEYAKTPRHKPGRLAQLTAIKENLGDAAFCLEIVSGLKNITPEQCVQLQAHGLIEERRFGPQLGGVQLDLSVAAFDRVLRQRNHAFLSENAPVFAVS